MGVSLVSSKNGKAPTAQPRAVPMRLEFRGDAREYFRIWIVNLCLTIVTLGVFSAWAKVRKKRYFYSHTLLDGTAFQYLGQPFPIFKGRVVAAVIFGVYYFSSHFYLPALPYILSLGLVAAPLLVIRAAKFNARYSAYRNISFRFNASYWAGLKSFLAWGVLPAFIAATLFRPEEQPKVAAGLFMFGVVFLPLWMRGLKAFLIRNASYGGQSGNLTVTRRSYWGIYLAAALFPAVAFVLAATCVLLLKLEYGSSRLAAWILFGASYVGYGIAFAFVQKNTINRIWTGAQIGSVRFQSNLRFWKTLLLYTSNALGILASGGLLIPWAVVRTLRFRIENLKVLREGALEEFVGKRASTVRAVGSETADLFDWDIAI